MAEIEHLRSLISHACNEVIANTVNPNPSNNSRTSFATPRSIGSQASQHQFDTTDILTLSAKYLSTVVDKSDTLPVVGSGGGSGGQIEGLGDQGITVNNLRKQLKLAQDAVATSALHLMTVKGLASSTEGEW